MELNEYQERALDTAKYEENLKIVYPALGLGSEAGEVQGKVKKWLRGDYGAGELSEEKKEDLKGELGDVLWYIAVLARDLGLKLEDVAKANVAKLKSRQERNLIKGDGDKR
jgi:NTP pyrophosphatase (non-canonical NTP hydrolase)